MRLDTHSSALFAHSERGDEFLLSAYDGSYPLVIYRGRVIGTAGGMTSLADVSPMATLIREITEEFSIDQDYDSGGLDESIAQVIGPGNGAEKVSNFADLSLIKRLQNNLIQISKPHNDYVMRVPSLAEGRPKFNVLLSTYTGVIPQDLFEETRIALNQGKSVRNEGLAKIVSINDLVNGIPLTAWATGLVIGSMKNVQLPNPEGVILEYVGSPRASFKEYSDFSFARNVSNS
jgi:hypothetical protein